METKKQTKEIKKSRGVNAFIVIVACLILAECFFFFVLGKSSCCRTVVWLVMVWRVGRWCVLMS